ncbi:hypothetical protein Cni_G26911 [Canna indica]|uniref:Copper transport protein n=1 Tax=Canna indica TaxID=4628 RepID=A0AAQ3QQV4_9LILI|nr:hypothetical protein Cni_G26911 [Canna indica]
MDHDGMGDMGGMDMGKHHFTHMTFFWGKDAEILFSGWPGDRDGMYALALVVVFALAFLIEWLSHCRLLRPGGNHVAAGLAQTALHAVRVALAYLVMLALMSFNGGVMLVAVVGHATGYLLFASSAFRRTPLRPVDDVDGAKGDLLPMTC